MVQVTILSSHLFYKPKTILKYKVFYNPFSQIKSNFISSSLLFISSDH